MVRFRIGPVGQGSKGASHESNVAGGFLLYCRWSWQFVDREGLATGLTLRIKGGGGCNVLESSNVLGQNVSCCEGP